MSHRSPHSRIQRLSYLLASCAAALITLGALLQAASVQAANRDVCPACTYTTVQAAIAAAASNDTIRVAAGAYTESLVIAKSLTLRGGYSGPPSWTFNPSVYTTTVMGNNAQSVIAITGPVSVTLQGLTIENGRGVPNGGGVRSESASLTLLDNLVANNAVTPSLTLTDTFGAGVYVEAGSAVIDSNVFQANVNSCLGHNCRFPGGGGLYLSGTVTATVTNNLFDSNYSWSGGGLGTHNAPLYAGDNTFQNNTGAYGVGLYIEGQGLAIVQHNTLTGNLVGDQGTLFYTSLGSDGMIVSRNVVSGNQAYRASGILFDGFSAPLTLTNNLIVHNLSLAVEPDSGPLQITANQGWLTNNTFADNPSPAAFVPAVSFNGGSHQLTNNIFFSQTTAISLTSGAAVAISYTAFYSNGINWGGTGSVIIGAGILTATDPRFVDPNGDYHLRADSLLIDAGTSAGAPPNDLDGKPRPSGNGVDIGAYEYVKPLLLFLPLIRR